jgi:hypothetical protein
MTEKVRTVTAISVAFSLIAFCQVTHAGLHSGSEYDELQALYSSTNGANWKNYTNWGIGDACQWYGVRCDQDSLSSDNTSHVTEVVLTSNNLKGPFPELSGFTHLRQLGTSGNFLTGSIPSLSALTDSADYLSSGFLWNTKCPSAALLYCIS